MSIYQRKGASVKGVAAVAAPDIRLESSAPDGEATSTIVIEDEGLRAGFTQLPNYVFRIRGLSHGAKLTYALLLSYAWQKDSCFPGQQTLAGDLDVSVRSVGDYLRELQDGRLIRVQRRGLGKTNVYHILRLDGHTTPGRDVTAPPCRPEQDRVASPQTVAVGDRPAARTRRGQAALPEARRGLDTQVDDQPPPTRVPQGSGEDTTRQDRQDSAPPDRQNFAPPDRQNPARLDRHQSATAQRKRGSTLDTQRTASQEDEIPNTPTPDRQTEPTQTAQESGHAVAVQAARTVLAGWGVTDERQVAELCAVPADVLRQAAMLSEHLAAGRAISNPPGWLIAAVRGGYGHAESVAAGQAANQPDELGGAAGTSWPDGARHGLLAGADDGQAAGSVESGPRNPWEAVKAELRETTTATNFQRWFAPTVLVESDRGSLVVGVPGERERVWLERRLRSTVERAAATVLGQSPAISFVAMGRA